SPAADVKPPRSGARHGRPLEIEETLGYVVTQAAAEGLAVPTVDTCYRRMRGLNRCMQRASGSPCWRCGAEGISQGMCSGSISYARGRDNSAVHRLTITDNWEAFRLTFTDNWRTLDDNSAI